MEDERLQTQIAYRVGCGLGMVVAGILMTVAMLGGGSLAYLASRGEGTMLGMAYLGLGVVAAGVASIGWGVASGLRRAWRDDSRQTLRHVQGAYIVSANVTNLKHDPVYDPGMYGPDELLHYARVELPGAGVKEFKVPPGLFGLLGEGMRGTVAYRGDTLQGFWPDGQGSRGAERHQ